MKERFVGIILGLLVLVVLVSSEIKLVASPLFIVFFGLYMVGISWFGREKDDKDSKHPLQGV